MNWSRCATSCLTALSLCSCTSFNYLHDPKFGAVSNEELPKLIKSLRCELVTFYQVTYSRMRDYKTKRLPYFDLDNNLWGAFNLDLKVVDSIGIPGTNSVFTNKLATPDAAHSKTLSIGPSGSVSDTYELNWSFTIKQNADLTGRTAHLPAGPVNANASESETFECYKSVPVDLERLAAGEFTASGIESFKRIYVNGTMPLAAWLLDSGNIMASSYYFPDEKKDNEKAYPSQMIYTFTIMVSGGVDAKFSLISSRWNPLTPDISGSVAQTNSLVLYINGQHAITFTNAKGGNVLIATKKEPTSVVIVGQQKDIAVVTHNPGDKPGAGESPENPHEPNYIGRGAGGGKKKDYGTPIFPYGVVPP